MRSTVDVVIPSRNRCALLRQAVASIQRQTLNDWRLIVVDDASTDGTREWLASVAQQDARIRTARLDSHSERGAARNRGLAEVTAELVLFLDDDDRLVARGLERLVRGIRSHPKAVEAIGARVVFDENGHRRRAHHVRVPVTRPVWREMLAGWFAVPGQCLMRTEVLVEAGGWSSSIVGPEDQDLQLRLSKFGPAAFVPATVLEYRAHSGQWRPADLGVVEETLHQDFAEELVGKEREEALRLRRTHRILGVDAASAYRDGRYQTAVREYVRAIRSTPAVLVSPLTGPPLAGALIKAGAGVLLGSKVAAAARRSLRAGRRARRREPEGEASKTVRSSSARRE